MEYNKRIADLQAGDRIQGFYLLKSAVSKTTVSKKPFLAAVLADNTGEIEAKIWDYSGPIGSRDEGTILKIQGSVNDYKGKLQLIIEKIRLLAEGDQVDMGALLPVAPIDVDQYYRDIQDIVSTIEDEDYIAIAGEMLERHGEELRKIPAAKSVHHSFLHGLLMHTANMLSIADFLARQYEGTVNRSLLLTGTLLHDLAKSREFIFSELGLVTDYSVEGQLLGHLVMGAQEVADLCRENELPEEKSVLLQHMILSHHGEPEFGAAVRPACAEAELLSYIDLIDSRMEIYRDTLSKTEPGTFSNRIFALEKRVYHPQI